MSRQSETALIIGAGLQGCSIALFLARAGWNVTLLDKNVAGRHASSVNAGGLRMLMRDWREYPLSQRAMEHWVHLDRLVGEKAADACEVRLGVSQIGLALDEAEMSWAVGRAEDMKKRGLGEEELLSREDVRTLLPGVSENALGGLISRRDGHANPAAATRAFREAAVAAGARIVENCRVLGLERVRGGGWRAETSFGQHEGGVLINCGGAWGARVAAMAGQTLPLKTVAPSMMVTARTQPFLTPVVIGIDRPLSFKQSAVGSLVIGGGILGKPCPDQDTSFTVMDRMPQSAAATLEAFPALAHVPVLRTWTGLEGATPDGIPVIGPGQGTPDLWHVFGFCGHGFQLSPAVGEAVAKSLVSGTLEATLAPFDCGRFASRVAA
ncbi:glycine/D-amino acid oxidases [Acetobacter aceti NRIC 0242]|uniref:Sarcosine oxidase subunit beta n=1 Tax=Acetobacter aceti NBRC 14818 TaxID=887700 RepID=A0AB33IEU8_ACEAC|nr:FAD-dependent oxidoreductase [Acetobacter aceti]TCS31094.1 sarcosine oxidase subunit beta [Acetobacter aceti NBRC 14818]BCK76695.1 sarcosine oxidase subunit beta [Acetobacter aceti NBRC 14818]GAN58145.1 sarcosine oxidase beta subunit [Acetobacter aceti NBRC 14818]GBO82269.1 glycine/D-amino acid oxidases [Acetobacter aceti NRIC 0242]